jgi:hypothetical protein
MQLEEFLSSNDQTSDRVIWVDHRAIEEEIVGDCSAQMMTGDRLKVRMGGDDQIYELWVHFISNEQSVEQRIPLTESRHDRYGLLSALAVILKGHYSIYLLNAHLRDDTHGIALVKDTVFDSASEVVRQRFLAEFEPLEPGKDYFNNQMVPNLGAPNHNPTWQLESETQSQEFERVMEKVFQSPEMKGLAKDLPKKILKVVLLALLTNLFLKFWRSRFIKILMIFATLLAVYFIFGGGSTV